MKMRTEMEWNIKILYLPLLLTIALLVCPKPSLAQPQSPLAQGVPEQPQSIVHVIVSRDVNRNGVWEDIGPGIYVEARQGGQIVAINHTDDNSDAGFVLETGFYTFIAWVEPTRPLYVYDCRQTVEISKLVQYVDLRCIERFFLRFPFTLRG